MTKGWVGGALALALLLAPAALAHGAPPVRAIDVRLLLDDDGAVGYGGCSQGQCQPAVPPSGLDVLALDAREAWLDDGSPALVLRVSVQSEEPQPGASLVVHMTSGGKAHDVTLTTADGLNYTGQGTDRLDGPLDVGDGHPKALDLWLRQSTLGAKPGDAVSGLSVDSFLGTTHTDTMPGGWFEGGAPVPFVPSDPSKAGDTAGPASYTLRGPADLVLASAAASADLAHGPATVQVRLRNNTTFPQFATLHLAAPAGIAARLSPSSVLLDPGAERSVDLRVSNATAPGAVTLLATTDLGGRATLSVAVHPAPAMPANMTHSSTSASAPAHKSSPAPAAVLPLLASAATAARRRLRQRES
jgi:hypothetical protein